MNDILKPELLWIEGRCYRVGDATSSITEFHEHDLYENEINYSDDKMEDECDDFEVQMLDNSRYSTNFHVSKHYVGAIIGKKGAVKSRLERDTKTNIKIPRQGEAGDIYILGPSESNVRAARRRINLIVISSRLRQRPTHFISIPLNSPEIMQNFQLFKEQVLKDCPSRGIDESIFTKPEKLHLTLGVMCLMDNEERLAASKLLAQAKETVVLPLLQDYLPLKIRVKGLSYMNDDPSQVHVLYGLVTEEDSAGSDLIQKLGDSLVDFYSKAGYLQRYGDTKIKLHVTFIKSSNRLDSSSVSGEPVPNRRARESFDGSEILKKFADFDFGVSELKEIHLSQIHSMGADGYYQPTCIVSCK